MLADAGNWDVVVTTYEMVKSMAGVLARTADGAKYFHCGMQLPPAVAQRHCYRVAVIQLLGDDRLPR